MLACGPLGLLEPAEREQPLAELHAEFPLLVVMAMTLNTGRQ